MNSPVNSPGISSSQVGAAAESTLVSRMGNAVTAFFARVTARFQDAADGYRFEFGRLRKLPSLTVDVRSLQAMRVSGMLICETNKEIVVLQEGSNFFKVSDKGLVRAQRPENPYERPQLNISVVGDRLIREDAEGATQKYLTNDRAVLGNRTYVVKVLPEEYRREQRLKGDAHV